MTTITQSPAQQITADYDETIGEFTDRMRKKTHKPLTYRDGNPIRIKPGVNRVSVDFEFAEGMPKATPEEFLLLFNAINAAIQDLEDDGKIRENWIANVSTPRDISIPPIPDWIAEQVQENMEMKCEVRGSTYLEFFEDYTDEWHAEQERIRKEQEEKGREEVEEEDDE